MQLLIYLWLRHYQKTMILPCVTSYDGRTGITPSSIGSYNFPIKGIIEIDQLGFVKMDITHVLKD